MKSQADHELVVRTSLSSTSVPNPLPKEIKEFMSVVVQQFRFSWGSANRNPTLVFEASGVTNFEERLRVHDVRSLSTKEIEEQYTPAYVDELLKRAKFNGQNLRAARPQGENW